MVYTRQQTMIYTRQHTQDNEKGSTKYIILCFTQNNIRFSIQQNKTLKYKSKSMKLSNKIICITINENDS